jgi:hypothetical protein
MEKALTKLSSFTIPRKAKQELSAIGGDISVSAASFTLSAPFLFFSFLSCLFLFLGDSEVRSSWFLLVRSR